MQELVEVVGRATGVVLMAPPVEHAEAAAGRERSPAAVSAALTEPRAPW